MRTTGPYDLDKDIERILGRGPKPRKARKPEQLSLFGPVHEIVEHPYLYETTDGLVVDVDDAAFARAVSLHSSGKADCARRYAEIVGMAIKSWYTVWIELFAGPGKLYVRETGRFVPGSPVEALNIPRRFNR